MPSHPPTLEPAVRIVVAYLAAHELPASEIPGLLASVKAALDALAAPSPAPSPVPAPRPRPAVPVRESVAGDCIVCLEDGVRVKSLRTHIRRRYGLDPDAYRERWGLPADYPMVAPAYSAARASGLGRRRRG